MKYRMIGIDLDGTLLKTGGQPCEAGLEAIARAQERGVLVVPCTGRAWRESLSVLEVFPNPDLGVFATGAAICELKTGRSLDVAVIEPHLAAELVWRLQDLPESVLVLRDRNVVGHDYLITGRGILTDNTQWWFAKTGMTVHFQAPVTADDLHHTLRVGVVGQRDRVYEMETLLRPQMGDRVVVQHFDAIASPVVEQSVSILELFAGGVDKWHGLKLIAERRDIDPSEIAFIGDEINDVPALEGAACGIAMGNAVSASVKACDRQTQSNNEEGVARAIEKLLAGHW